MLSLRYLALILGLLAPAIQAAPACGDTRLKRAQFAMAVADHEPVGEVSSTPDSHEYLFFFMEVIDGNNKTLRHRWYRDGELVAEVKLAIGANRWRTWSRKFLGTQREASWRVDVVDPNECVLGTFSLSNNGKLPVLEQAKSMLKSGDLIGARLLVKNEMANNLPYRHRLERFLDQDLVLAQLSQQIADDQLYTGEARLAQLKALKLNTKQAKQLEQLQTRLEDRRAALGKQINLALASAAAVLRQSLNGGSCPNSDEDVLAKLDFMPNSDQLLVSAWSRQGTALDISLIDQRTGMLHNVSLDCPGWQ